MKRSNDHRIRSSLFESSIKQFYDEIYQNELHMIKVLLIGISDMLMSYEIISLFATLEVDDHHERIEIHSIVIIEIDTSFKTTSVGFMSLIVLSSWCVHASIRRYVKIYSIGSFCRSSFYFELVDLSLMMRYLSKLSVTVIRFLLHDQI